MTIIDRAQIARLRPAQRRLLAHLVAQDGGVLVPPAGDRLVAYVLADERDRPAAAELRRHVAAALPDYMVPASIVVLDTWPRTASGKLDRDALRTAAHRVALAGRTTHVPPRDDVERTIARVWQELLGLPSVGTEENFFELGGHSLLLVRLQSRLRAAFGVDLTIVEMFRFATVAGLADAIRASRDAPKPVMDAGVQARASKQRAALGQRAIATSNREPK